MEHIPQSHDRVEKLLNDMQEILDRSADTAVEKLKQFVALEPKQNQVYATLELYTDQNYELTYNRALYMEQDGKKYFDYMNSIYNEFESRESFLPELEEYASKAFEGVDYTDAEAESYNPRFTKMMVTWFGKCWDLAGGDTAKTPTYFAMDKEGICYDLKTGEALEPIEAARRAGHEVA